MNRGGRYWGWDPKETWALITLLVYTFVTHSRHIPRLSNDFAFSAMSLAAIASVLMTFFGVNYYLSGLHSYGGSGEVAPSHERWKTYFAMDFQNDGEFVGGCIAGEETIATLIRTEMWNRVYLSIILEPI